MKCAVCGAEYVPHFQGDKFCSDDCCWEYYPDNIKVGLMKLMQVI